MIQHCYGRWSQRRRQSLGKLNTWDLGTFGNEMGVKIRENGASDMSCDVEQVLAALTTALFWSQGPEYVLVIDGGSSGTRMYASHHLARPHGICMPKLLARYDVRNERRS